jgi:hypothetical protein
MMFNATTAAQIIITAQNRRGASERETDGQ